MTLIPLIDADIIVYRAGFAGQKKTEDAIILEPEGIVLYNVQSMINKIYRQDFIQEPGHLFLTSNDKSNFRYKLAKTPTTQFNGYKGNRDPKQNPNCQGKPYYYDLIRDYLQVEFKAKIIHGMEADDMLAGSQTENTIICSIDKDLLQVPGHHYNFVKNQHVFITKEEGLINFYKQLLIGDKDDNIPGLPRVGPKTAEKILQPIEEKTELNLFKSVLQAYKDYLSDLTDKEIETRILEIGNLLYLRRDQSDEWKIPR